MTKGSDLPPTSAGSTELPSNVEQQLTLVTKAGSCFRPKTSDTAVVVAFFVCLFLVN